MTARAPNLLVARCASYLLSALTSILVARTLGSHDRGVWAIALLVSGLIALSCELGLGAAVFSLSRQERGRRQAVIAVGCILSVAFSGLASGLGLLGASHEVIPFVRGIPPDILALALGTVVLTNLIGVGRQALYEDGDLAGGAAIQLIQAAALFGGLLATSTLIGLSIRNALGVFIVSLLTGVGFVALRLIGRNLLAPSWERGFVMPLLRTGFSAYLATLALTLTFRFDLLLVNAFRGPNAAGLYSVALSLSEMLRGLPEVGQSIVLARSSPGHLVDIVRETTRLFVLATFIAGAAACAVAYWAIPMVFGAEFAGSVAPFMALVPGVIGLCVSYCVSPVLLVQGRTHISATAAIASFCMMAGLDLLVIPRWGLTGAALVSSLAYWLAALVQVRWIGKFEPFSLQELRPRWSDWGRLYRVATRILPHRG